MVSNLKGYLLHPDRAWLLVFLPSLLSYLFLLQQRINYKEVIGSIQRYDPAVDELIPRYAKVEVIAEGFDWTEGPIWVEDEEAGTAYLLFSDVKQNKIWKWERGGLFTIGTSLFLEKSGCRTDTERCARLIEPGSNGLVTQPSSKLLVVCEHGERRVSRLESNGTRVPLATHFRGQPLNSPNDAVFSPEGHLWFTDPPYGLNGKEGDPEFVLGHSGVYRVPAATIKALTEGRSRKPPEPELLVDDMTRPNGLAFSPDFSVLYISNSGENSHVRAYSIDMEGNLASKEFKLFFDAKQLQPPMKGPAGSAGGPEVAFSADGLKVDARGNLWVAGAPGGGVLVLAPDGRHLGTVATGAKTGNIAFGDGYLYIAADSKMLRVAISVKKAILPEIKD